MAQTLTSNAFFTSDASGMNLMGMGAIFLSITYRINVNYKQIYITYPREREKKKRLFRQEQEAYIITMLSGSESA